MFDVIQAFKDVANKFSALQTAINGKANSGHSHSNYASTVTTTGSGNAVTEISQSGNTVTATKGKTFSESGHTHNYAGSPRAGGDANNALKLGGRSLTADGNRWGSVPFVGDDGVMEVGRYIDFHLRDADAGTSGDTTGGRMEADGSNLKFNDKKVSMEGHSHGWVKVTPVAESGITITNHYCAYNKELGLGTIRMSVKITPSADKSSGASVKLATVSGDIVAGKNCPLATHVAVTNARRWVANLGSSGSITVRASTALTADTTYELFICGTFPLG